MCRTQGGDVLDLTQVWQQAGLGVDQLGIDLNKWVTCISRGYPHDIYISAISRWVHASASIVTPSRAQESHRLVWEATVGAKEMGNIAIDDVTFTPGCV